MLKQNVYLIVILAVAVVGTQSFVHSEASLRIAELSSGYVHEDGRLELPEIWQHTADVPVYTVGFVDTFHGPLAHLDTSDPDVEYTWITADQVSAEGFISHYENDCTMWSIDSQGGRLRILRDITPDADLSDPSTFADGEIVLEGRLAESSEAYPHNPFSLFAWGCPSGGRGRGVWFTLELDGGVYFSELSPEGSELYAEVGGTYQIGEELSQTVLDLDYFAVLQVTIRVDDSVPVKPTTWGRIKALYR